MNILATLMMNLPYYSRRLQRNVSKGNPHHLAICGVPSDETHAALADENWTYYIFYYLIENEPKRR